MRIESFRFLMVAVVFTSLVTFIGSGLAQESRSVIKVDFGENKDVNALKALGFKTVPETVVKDGARLMKGPCDLELKPMEGVVDINFLFLGFESTQQQDMIFINSDMDKPFAVIRNVNSSGRIDGKAVISEKSHYKPDFWHKVNIQINTRSGNIKVVTDGKPRYDNESAVKDAKFTGMRFASLANIRDLSIEVAALPPLTEAESKIKAEKTREINDITAEVRGLESKVAGLPVASPDEQRKKAALEVAAMYLMSCIDGDKLDRAKALISDIEYGLAKDMGEMDNSQRFFLPMASPDKNKDLAEFHKAVELNLAAKDKLVPVITKGKGPFAEMDINQTRRNGDEMFNYLFATAHKDSRYLNDVELFKRCLNRVLAFIEADQRNSNFSAELFTQDRSYFAVHAFLKVFPGILLPSQSALLTSVADGIHTKYLEDYKEGKLKDWINGNLSEASSLVHAGLILGNKEYVDAGLAVLALHTGEQFADGGLQYFRGQNESIGYHGINIDAANRIYLSTGNQTALDLIKKSANHTLLSVEPVIVGSFSSAPSWKWAWNSGYSTPRPAAFHTRSPYLKAYQDAGRTYSDAANRPQMNAFDAMLDISDIKTKPLPDNYNVYDANIAGSRSRHGNFSTFMIGRDVGRPTGLLTYVAAMAVDNFDPKRPKPLNASMKSVNAGPWLRKNNGNPEQRWDGTANLGVKHKNTSIIGHDFSALTTKHILSGHSYGPSRWDSSWSGEQQWLALPGRMIGMVTVNPGTENAFDVRGVVKLGHGWSGVVYPKKIQRIDDANYTYGDLAVKIHGQNYGKTSVQEKSAILRGDRTAATDIILTDDISAKDGTQSPRKYEKPYYFIVECAYMDAKGEARVERIDNGAVKGIKVAVNGETYAALQNAGQTAVDVMTSDYVDGQAYIHNEFVPGQENAPVKSDAASIAPGKGIVVTNGRNASKAPFKSFDDMMSLYDKGMADGVTPFPSPGMKGQ